MPERQKADLLHQRVYTSRLGGIPGRPGSGGVLPFWPPACSARARPYPARSQLARTWTATRTTSSPLTWPPVPDLIRIPPGPGLGERPAVPMSGGCAPVYVCICCMTLNIGRRSFIQSCRSYRGRACRIGRASSSRKCRALACRVSVMRGQLSRRPAPVTAADGPARQASPRVVT